jgi:hypothetical protein
MRFRASVVSLLLGTALVCTPHLVHADDEELTKSLHGAMKGALDAYDREDLDGTMRYVHTKSPEYDKTKVKMEEQFAAGDVTIQLVEFRYIGHDDEFAVARVHIKTIARNDPTFTDNMIDTITLFKMENGQWKWWSDHIIGVHILE